MGRSPVSELDHIYFERVSSVGLCACGAVTKTAVAIENRETGLERLRRLERR